MNCYFVQIWRTRSEIKHKRIHTTSQPKKCVRANRSEMDWKLKPTGITVEYSFQRMKNSILSAYSFYKVAYSVIIPYTDHYFYKSITGYCIIFINGWYISGWNTDLPLHNITSYWFHQMTSWCWYFPLISGLLYGITPSHQLICSPVGINAELSFTFC